MSERDLTISEAAALSGYSEGHIRWLARQGKVQYRRIGQRVLLIERESLIDYAERMRELGVDKYAPG